MEANQYTQINDFYSFIIVTFLVIFPLGVYLDFYFNTIESTPAVQIVSENFVQENNISIDLNNNYTLVSMCVQTRPLNGSVECVKYEKRPCIKLKNTSTEEKLICEVWA